MTDRPTRVQRLTEAALPTRVGLFRAIVYGDLTNGSEPVALVHGDVASGPPPLVRLHSECFTGDVLRSLRCDCGEQLDQAMAAIASEGRGVLVYLRQEGRGIGLANKIRAYALQDGGLDTVDANAALGLPIDAREYGAAAAVLVDLGVRSVRLMTNNPDKPAALQENGITISDLVPITALANPVNLPYLEAKARRLGHRIETSGSARPLVTVHYAQTLDGRLATRTGDSQWISGEESLRLAHGLRASHEAVAVGIGTVLADDPRLTVRLVPGESPVRVVVDSTLRVPLTARLLSDGNAPTIVATTNRADPRRRREVEATGAEVVVLEGDPAGRGDREQLRDTLGEPGNATLLRGGGARLINGKRRGGPPRRVGGAIATLLDRHGIEAVGELDIRRLRDALTFRRARFTQLGADVIFDGELEPQAESVA